MLINVLTVFPQQVWDLYKNLTDSLLKKFIKINPKLNLEILLTNKQIEITRFQNNNKQIYTRQLQCSVESLKHFLNC